MAGPDFSLIDRRRLLASAAAMTAAGAMPRADRHTAASHKALPPAPAVQTTKVRAAKGRLADIVRRNIIRREAGLPLLLVAAEWRRIKRWEDRQARDEAFERFAAAHEKEIWGQVLKQRREKEQNPDWWPHTLFEGVDCQRQVRKILRDQFARVWLVRLTRCPLRPG